MAIEHRITSTDTIRTLAQYYLGDSNKWQELAEFNHLSYPFIVEDDHVRRNMTHGNGYVRIQRTNYRNARVVTKGWQMVADSDVFSGQQRVFEVTEDVRFGEGEQTAYVHVRSTVRGVLGNLTEGSKLLPGRGFMENGFGIEEAYAYTNFDGGQDVRVLTIGEYIYIPDQAGENTYTDWSRMVEAIGESDIALNADGEVWVDGFGDIASVNGLDNIIAAINHRLMTERGSLRLHPLYGSGIHGLIGKTQSPYRLKMIELDVYETLAYEDRIRDVTITDIRVEGTSVYVTLTFRLQEVERVEERSLSLNYSGLIAS